MKIGIMTLRNHNYGGVLQTFALQRSLERIPRAARVETIDFYIDGALTLSNRGTHLLYEPDHSTQSRYIQARELYKEELDERFRLFEAFISGHINLSKRYKDFPSLNSDYTLYDVYIAGGDQIWNTLWFYNKAQYPMFLASTNSRNKIAYGCGMYSEGNHSLMRLELDTLALLRPFKRIMVRERTGAETLRRYLNKTVDVVLDPTLLLCAEDYKPLMKKPAVKIDSPYIFAYFLPDITGKKLNDNEKLARALTGAAKASGKRVILISSEIPINNDYVTTVIAAGPAEWLWLAAHAEHILTSSFHGLSLAVVFNRPFIAVNRDERKDTLLSALGLERHLVDDMNALSEAKEISVDYSTANVLLANERARCESLLKDAVEMCRQGGENG